MPPAADGGLFGAHRTSAIAGGGAAFAVAAIVVATQLFGGSDEKRSANRIVPSPAGVKRASRSPSATAAPVERSGVTVTVLNGTTTTGLARGAANRLQANGYTIGQVTNAADQSRPSTSVSYARGFRRLGLDVARLLRVNSRSVHPMDAATRVVAGEDAMIVVTVGADQSP